MLLECIFLDMELQFVVEILEEDFSEMIAFADYDGILIAEIRQRRECGPGCPAPA